VAKKVVQSAYFNKRLVLKENNKMKTKTTLVLSTVFLLAILLIGGLMGCNSEAEVASENLVVAAEKFQILRKVIFYNGITDSFIFAFEGLCSIEDQGHHVEVTCKDEDGAYLKHIQGLSDNVTYTVIQLSASPVSGYRPRILVRPETIIPDLELDLSLLPYVEVGQ
jgi:hypothetical protein